MSHFARPGLFAALALLSACAAPRDPAEDSWGRRASDFVAPLVPEPLRPGPRGPLLQATARVEPKDFKLADRREVTMHLIVKNNGRRPERLDFPTTQRLEVLLRGPDGKQLFLWSEDRLFEAKPATVVVNPGERIEYEAAIPTRDMVAGGEYTVEALLHGRPDLTAVVAVRPQ